MRIRKRTLKTAYLLAIAAFAVLGLMQLSLVFHIPVATAEFAFLITYSLVWIAVLLLPVLLIRKKLMARRELCV